MGTVIEGCVFLCVSQRSGVIQCDGLDWQGDIDEAVAWQSILNLAKHPLSASPSFASLSLLIPIEKWMGRLGKQERMRRRGATEQAKGSTDIHGNLQIHSAVIISINAERQCSGVGLGQGGVGEFWREGLHRMKGDDGGGGGG